MAIDSDWSSVVLAMHMDGTNGSTSFIDLRGHTMTAVGNAQISTAQSKFGGASALFDGTGDAVTTPDSTDWAFGSDDFTIEAQVRPTDFVSFATIVAQRLSTITTDFWGVRVDITTGTVTFFAVVASVVVISRTTTTALTAATWAHVAVVRKAGVLKIYINGTEGGTTGADSTISLADTAAPLFIGAALETYAYPFKGYIDDVRITKGVARYIANFTAPTAAFDEGTPPYANLTAPMPTLGFYGGASFMLSAPLPTLGFYGGASFMLSAPLPYLAVGVGATTAVIAPAPTLSFTAHSSYGENAVIAIAPTPTLSAYLGGNATLTATTPTLSSAATGTAFASAALTAPAPTLSSTATGSYTANARLSAPTPNLVGYGGAVCSITTSAGTITSTGTGGGIARAALTATVPLLSATGTAQSHGSALLVAPAGRMVAGLQAYLIAPAATLTAIGTATITATYEAYALNLKHISVPGQTTTDEMTRYTNFPFTQVVRYQNSYYGVNDTGLYLLEGTTDDGDAIPFTVQTAVTDFGVPNKKTINSAYFGGRLGPAETVSVLAGETTPVAYSYTTPRGPLAQNYRQAFGRGIKARYFALRVVGTADFKLDTLDTETDQLTRRI